MALVVANVGELLLLNRALRLSNQENLVLKLYKNDVTPSASSVAGDFTECDFSGYSSITLANGTWAAASTSGGKATSSYGEQTFTSSGGSQTVYGVYVVGATSGTLYYAERFSTAKTVTSGDSVVYNPTLTNNSEN